MKFFNFARCFALVLILFGACNSEENINEVTELYDMETLYKKMANCPTYPMIQPDQHITRSNNQICFPKTDVESILEILRTAKYNDVEEFESTHINVIIDSIECENLLKLYDELGGKKGWTCCWILHKNTYLW